jgi:hypothetical protein
MKSNQLFILMLLFLAFVNQGLAQTAPFPLA